MLAPFLAFSLVNPLELENKSQFNLKKDSTSKRMNDFLINCRIPVTLYSNMLNFRDSNISFNLDGVLFKAMATYNFNVAHSNPQDRKLIYEFPEEFNFTIKQIGRKSNRDHSRANLLESPAIRVSGILTLILPENPNELCDRN